VFCLSTIIVSSVMCYVDNGTSRNMTANISSFFMLEEQDFDMQVKLSDDAKYSMIGMDSISFCMLRKRGS
jgi:hypothetical protein